MNKNIFLLALLFLASTIFIGCRSTEEDDSPPVETIEVADERTLTQTIYANRTTGNSVNFNTTTPWQAEVDIVATSLSTRSAGENSWISISPRSGSTRLHNSVLLSDMVSGSGDTGTPVILIHGYLTFCRRNDVNNTCRYRRNLVSSSRYVSSQENGSSV